MHVGLGDDRIPQEDRLGAVAAQLRGDRARDATTFHVPDGRSAKVVHDAARTPGRDGRPLPGRTEVAPAASIIPAPDVPDDLSQLALLGGRRGRAAREWSSGGASGRRHGGKTVATRLMKSGVSPCYVQGVLGHRSLVTAMACVAEEGMRDRDTLRILAPHPSTGDPPPAP